MDKAAPYPRPSLAQLFMSFFRLGLTAFGGPSMVAYIRKMSVDQKGWLSAETFNDGVALCQMIPGATAMQVTAFVGLCIQGVSGAAACFIGFGLPAFLIMMAFSEIYIYSYNLPVVISAFSGLHAIIVAIVANATLSFGRTTLKSWRHFAVAAVSTALFGLNVNPIFVILAAALGGLALIRSKEVGNYQDARLSKVQSTTRPLMYILSIAAIGLLVLFLVQRPLFDLATLFMRIDLFAFGGGFASIPLMLHEIVDVRGWIDNPTFLNGIALGQVTPGPIVITATFIGYLLHGPIGAVIATASIFLPSFCMVIGIVPVFDRLRGSHNFNRMIGGILCSFVGLLLAVTIRFAMNVHWDISHLLLAGSAFIALMLKVDILWVVIVGILFSLFLFR